MSFCNCSGPAPTGEHEFFCRENAIMGGLPNNPSWSWSCPDCRCGSPFWYDSEQATRAAYAVHLEVCGRE